jgi:hypothetical protein
MFTRSSARPFRTYTWTQAQLTSAERYTKSGQMRIVCQLQETREDQYVCLVDCDDRTGLLLHFI